jgi:predicted protein tyrosine phosphatase
MKVTKRNLLSYLNKLYVTTTLSLITLSIQFLNSMKRVLAEYKGIFTRAYNYIRKQKFRVMLANFGAIGTLSVILDDRLFLSGSNSARRKGELTKAGVTHIINCAVSECANTFDNNTDYQPKYHNIHGLQDIESANIVEHFEICNQFIHEALAEPQNRVLVHCRMGISRSATIIIAYLMTHHDMNLKQAYEFVVQKRSVVSPNFGFWKSLVALEERLRGQCTFPLEEFILANMKSRWFNDDVDERNWKKQEQLLMRC